ncbi:hypothetical protein ACLMJK_006399 [Lecanora helva]
MADAVSQGGALPSISYLDIEKIKRESSGYNHKPPVTSVLSMSAPLISPSTVYSGPPPPYSYPSSAASSTVGGDRNGSGAGAGNYMSPPETRRTSGDEKEPLTSQRQSLPSITEALGGEQQPLSISSLLSTSAPQQKAPHTSQNPISPVARSYLDAVPKGPPDSLPHQTSSHRPQDTPDRTTRAMYPSPAPTATATTNTDSRFPSLSTFPSMSSYESYHPPPSAKTIPSPSTYSRPGASPIQRNKPSSPLVDKVPGTSAAPSNIPFGYNVHAYQPSTTFGPSTPGVSSYRTPTLQQQSNWRPPYGHPDERMEEIRKAMSKESTPPKQAYGEHVKRHLDIFDLESSLNEIAEGSGRCLHFSRDFSARAHQTQRSGPLPGSLPSLKNCEEMIEEQQKVMNALNRMRGLICKQQQALDDQRNFDQQHYKPAASEAGEDVNSYLDSAEGSGGFAGADAKKRRGRAAPPGRCHSCNRAETPEWRRGPDGARTLCNACGLHYAKLTRKMGTKAPPGPSNLRPKESSPSSP